MPSFTVKIGSNNDNKKTCVEERLNALIKMLGNEVSQHVKKEINDIMEIITKNEVIDKNIENRINQKLEELENEIDDLIKNKMEQYPNNPIEIINKSKDMIMDEICVSINIDRLRTAFREGLGIKDDQDL